MVTLVSFIISPRAIQNREGTQHLYYMKMEPRLRKDQGGGLCPHDAKQ